MGTMTQTEFNRNPSEAARVALRDGILVVTNQGRPSLDLVPHLSERDPRGSAISAGLITPRSATTLDISLFTPVLPTGTDFDAYLNEVNGDHEL